MSAATILTLASGRDIDLLDPHPEDYADQDWIAEHLAKEPRYNGATPGEQYSVAEHAQRVADAAYKVTGDKLLAGYLLKHDDHEGVWKDDTTPKKNAIAEKIAQRCGVLATHILQCLEELTATHDAAIHAACGLPWPPSPAMRAAIKLWDRRALLAEWRDLMPVEMPNRKAYAGIAPLEERIIPAANWKIAKIRYLDACIRYLPARSTKAA